MDVTVLLLVAALVIGIAALLSRTSGTAPASLSAAKKASLSDEQFAEVFAHVYGGKVWRSFHMTIAGPSFPNADGSSRTKIIADCAVFDWLKLVPDPENRFHDHAIEIRRQECGRMLGIVVMELKADWEDDLT